jgi:nucleoside-diphosphate-sugar epimerase
MEPYIGKIEQHLSFIYAKDMASVAVNALTSQTNGTYNLSDGNTYSRYDLANFLKLYMKKKTIKFHLPFGLVKMMSKGLESSDRIFNKTPILNEDKLNELTAKNWICSIEKAKQDLNFKPLYNLEKGVLETLNWYQEFKWL